VKIDKSIDKPSGEPTSGARHGHDIVVVGASEGGIEALSVLVAGLPADLPAAVFVVIHSRPGTESRFPELLSRRGPLRARHAIHGEPIVPGRIYVAPPDDHLLLRPGHVRVVRGPKENGFRPSVDALFRTASIAYGPRVIGVVLTGNLDCGTAGLLSIKARGGIALVQDPRDAAIPAMPRSAIDHVAVDHVAAVASLPSLIATLVAEAPGPKPESVPIEISELEGDEPGTAAELVCPICQGKLTETVVGGFSSFRCHVGHSFSLESVAAEQAEEVERALWASVRALEETARLSGRLAASTTGDTKTRFAEKAETQMQHADLIRRILLTGEMLTETDATRLEKAEGAKR
jgi:two-component system, chemotaxis family, protein-glutamate methylesterase/glutaminase